MLINARVVQGAAAAVLLPASMSLIRKGYPDARARALGIWASAADRRHRRAAARRHPRDGRPAARLRHQHSALRGDARAAARRAPVPLRPARFNGIGQLLAIITLVALIGSLIKGGPIGYRSPPILGGFVVAVVAGAAFVRSQRRGESPMLPLEVSRPPQVRLALALGFAFTVSNFGTSFLISLYLQQHHGLDPLHAGLLFLISSAFGIVGNLLSGRATNRFGPRVPVLVEMVALAASALAIAAVAPVGAPALMTAMLAFTGFGGASAMPPTSGIVLASVPQQLAGTANAVFNTFRQIGGAVAIAVFGVLVAAPERFVQGMQLSMVATATLVLLVVVAGARTSLPRNS